MDCILYTIYYILGTIYCKLHTTYYILQTTYHTIPYHTIPYHTIPYHTISYQIICSLVPELIGPQPRARSPSSARRPACRARAGSCLHLARKARAEAACFEELAACILAPKCAACLWGLSNKAPMSGCRPGLSRWTWSSLSSAQCFWLHLLWEATDDIRAKPAKVLTRQLTRRLHMRLHSFFHVSKLESQAEAELMQLQVYGMEHHMSAQWPHLMSACCSTRRS